MNTATSIYTATEVETHFDELIARVEQGETIIITRDGKALAKLIPYTEDAPVK